MCLLTLVLLVGGGLLRISTISAVGRSPEGVLLDSLLKDYNSHVRPTTNASRPIDVFISFYMTTLLGLDEKNQVLTTFGWLEVKWRDDFLQWNSSEFSDIERIVVPANLIWLPDFGLENSVEAIYDEHASSQFRVGIDSDGWVQWAPGGRYSTSCQLDIRLYPFDRQTCHLAFVDWTYDGRFVRLRNGSATIGTDVYHRHGEWELVSTSAMLLEQHFDSDPGITFPTVKFVLTLSRKPRFYMVNIITPCMLMSVLALIVFLLPPDSGEKISLGITVLLSFFVFHLLVAENVPKTSDCVPLIGIYLMIVMVMAATSIVTSVIVLEIHHHDPASRVPRWLQHLAFDKLAPALCVVTMTTGGGHQPRCSSTFSRGAGWRERRAPADDKTESDADTDTDTLLPAPARRKATVLLEEILDHLAGYTDKMKRAKARELIKQEWRLLAKVVDRVLLIFFIVVITLLSLAVAFLMPVVMAYRSTW